MIRVLFVALTVGFLAGCNVFEGLYEEGSSDDPVVLQADADLALQRGDADKAVQYLEKALEKQPENPAIRTKLSTAILQASEINVIKMIELAEEISGESSSAKRTFVSNMYAVASKSAAESCNFDPSRKSKPIVLSENSSYESIRSAVDALRRVHALLTPVVGNASKLNEMSKEEQKTALLNAAISEVLLVLIDVEEKTIEVGASLWSLTNKDVGLCADDEAGLIEIQVFVRCAQIPRMQNALELLKQRISDTANDDSGANDAIEEVQKNIDLLAAEIDVDCR